MVASLSDVPLFAGLKVLETEGKKAGKFGDANKVVMEKLGEPMEKAHTVMGKWGYTGSACLPMAMDDAAKCGRLNQGDLVMLTASGAGLAMASMALVWNPGRAS